MFGYSFSNRFFSVAVTDGVRKLPTYAAEGVSKKAPNNTSHDDYIFVVSNAIDGSLIIDHKTCFISDKQSYGFADFHIPMSMVTHVEILNVGENGSCLFKSVCLKVKVYV